MIKYRYRTGPNHTVSYGTLRYGTVGTVPVHDSLGFWANSFRGLGLGFRVLACTTLFDSRPVNILKDGS